MRARGFLLALFAVSAALRAEGQQQPDWFDAFRGKAYLQGDSSFVAREASAPPDAPPLFRLRWLVVRYAGFSEAWRRFWPYRNMLLVTMPSGARYVLESASGFLDENHLEEERPFQRVASGRAAFEVWSGGQEPSEGTTDTSPCEGNLHRVRAPGGTLEFFLDDFGSRTVRASLAEIRVATFDENERQDLSTLLRMSIKDNRSLGTEFPTYNFRDPVFTLSVAFRDQILPPDKRTVVTVPDPAPPGDLSAWRGLAHLPLDLPPFPALPPENPIQ